MRVPPWRQARNQPTSSPVRFMPSFGTALRSIRTIWSYVNASCRFLSSVRAGVERVVRPADLAPMKSLLEQGRSAPWSFGRVCARVYAVGFQNGAQFVLGIGVP